MKNLYDITTSNVDLTSFIVSTTNKVSKSNMSVYIPTDYNLSKVEVSRGTIVYGGKEVLLGNNLLLENNSLRAQKDLNLNSLEIEGSFDQIAIKDNSLSVSKIENVEGPKIYSSSGPIAVGQNLLLENNKLKVTSGNILPGLITFLNSPNIVESGIYIYKEDYSGSSNINIDSQLSRVYIINSTGGRLYMGVGQTVIYNGEISLVSQGNVVASNYGGEYYMGGNYNSTATYLSDDLIIENVYVDNNNMGTPNNPIVRFYSHIGYLKVRVVGPDGTRLTGGIHYDVDYDPIESLYTVIMLNGSNSSSLGAYELGGIVATNNDTATTNGIYSIEIEEYGQTEKAGIVATFAIYIPRSITVQDRNIIIKKGDGNNIVGNILSYVNGVGTSVVSYSIGGDSKILNSPEPIINVGAFMLNSDGSYELNLLSKLWEGVDSVAIAITCVDINGVEDSGIITFSLETYVPQNLKTIKVDYNNPININVLEALDVMGGNLTITSGVKTSEVVNDFGTISLSQEGNLVITPQLYSTNSYSWDIEIADSNNEIFSRTINVDLIATATDYTEYLRIDLNGCFSEIKYREIDESVYKEFNGTDILSINRLEQYSTGREIRENGTFYDGNYYKGYDDLHLSIEDQLLVSGNNIVDREYTTSAIKSTDIQHPLPTSSYVIQFDGTKRIHELLVSPSISSNKFMPLPTKVSVYRSLDGGLSWILMKESEISIDNIEKSWYPYEVTDPLLALLQTGGFFRVEILEGLYI